MLTKYLLSLIFIIVQVYSIQDYRQLVDLHEWYEVKKDTLEIQQKSSANDDNCDQDLLSFQQGLERNEPWAVIFADTWAKIQAGYLSGNTINIGDFDSCVKFEHPITSSRIYKGQHCLVGISALSNSTLEADRTDLSLKHLAKFFKSNGIVSTNGFCMPASCSVAKIIQFLNQNILNENDLGAVGAQCRDMSVHLEPLDYFAIVLFSLFALLIIASTTYELIILKSKHSEPNKLLASFSVYSNGYKLFEITKIKSPSSINCLHGLRAMSIFWIILGHRITNQYPWGNPKDFQAFILGKSIATGIINAHTLAVDTFFVMGALLMTWSTLKDCEKKQLNIPRMIWRRYIRYTPVYSALILAVVSFSKVILQGPFYIEELRASCVKNWWMTLLHVLNYLQQKDMCLNHGWYLSADFQLFIISPFIILMIHKYGKKFLLIPAVLFLATIIYIISISMVLDIAMPAPSASQNYVDFIYFPTHSRAGPWFVGIILGYYLFTIQRKKVDINKFLNGFMWIFTLTVLFSIVFLQLGFSSSTDVIQRGYHITFLALHRNLWAIALCWIIFACQNLKTGGIIRWFLSLPQWQPISRMGLSMYLIGAVYQVMSILNQRVPLYLNFWQLVPILLSDVFMIMILSTITYLAFEAPTLIIEDYIYKKIKNKP
ncbi:unnamed protein product [Chironomus riparius]|uniref:Nose resistant-to-fluoxetine protein N-terminal domain-containing protein n=1 Tax=Chironomus riparius TaxID=315576 RepID=A0A9N9WU38_9DIPT|nr:unnamed protein product [Chironomus riparius]